MFQNLILSTTTVSYADSLCTYPISEETRVSNLDVTLNSDSVSSLKDSVVLLTYEVKTEVTARLFNQAKYCGQSDWVAAVPQTFTQSSVCAGVNSVQEFKADLYGTEELYLDQCVSSTSSGCQTLQFFRVN